MHKFCACFLTMSLKHLKLSKNHFKTNLFFFQILVGGDPSPLGLWSDGRQELQSFLEWPSGNCRMIRIIQNLFHDT